MAGKVRMRLTDARIARLRPRLREYSVWDTRIPGLGVRVRPSGGASYILMQKHSGSSRRISLGPVTARRVEEVRRECHTHMAQSDPNRPREATRQIPRFREFVEDSWAPAHFPRYKPSTQKGVKSILSSQLLCVFGSTPLNRITRNRVMRWFDAYSQTSPGGANHALRLLRQVLNFAIACGHIGVNPAGGVKMNRRTAITRFLSRDELVRLHHALARQCQKGPNARQQADIIRLLLLTGCRRSEIITLRWREVEGLALALSDSKTGPRKVQLNAQARRIIDRQPREKSEFVFPSPRNPNYPRSHYLLLWDLVRREAALENVRLHDLRHTFASHAVMNGVPIPVVSRLLGHSSERMTLRYAHLADKNIQAVAERIGTAMAGILKPE